MPPKPPLGPESNARPIPPERVAGLTIDNKFIDGNGHVTYLGYPVLFERERQRFMTELGLEPEVISALVPTIFVRELKIKYKKQLVEGDEVIIKTTVAWHTNVSVRYLQSIEANGTPTTEFECVIALIGEDGQLFPIPEEIKTKLFPIGAETE